MADDPTRVVLHPDRPPGVLDALHRLDDEGAVDLIDAADDDETATALGTPGSVLVSYRWRPDFLTDSLAWIQTLGVGVEQFPLAELRERGVVVCNARGVNAACVAEHALAGLLAMTRNIVGSWQDQQRRRWTQHLGVELSQLTMGILGVGAIGGSVATRAQAFGMRVLGLRRSATPVAGCDEMFGPDRLGEFCARSDVLVVCLPGDDDTRGMIGAAELRALGAGWLVNVGRGGTVDEPALVEALTDGALRGAALDVVDGEPLGSSSPLWDVPGLLLTGHSAALSPTWGASWSRVFRANLVAARGGGDWVGRV